MIAGVLLDLSGVLYVGNEPLPGSLGALKRLRGLGLPVRFFTNTTSKPKHRILEDLRAMNIDCAADEVFTPAEAARNRLVAHKLKPHLLIHPDLAEDFEGTPESGKPALVLGDAGEGFSYQALNAAFRQLVDGAEFLALAGNRTFMDRDGQLSLDAGAFVAALEYATQRRATILGKPAAAFFEAALSSMNCPARDAVMVGDDAEADVSGAIAAGVGAGLLVRTGKYRPGVEAGLDPAPTAVVDDFAAAVDWIARRSE